MKVVILAAGYATRLYPLTLNQPKPLLEVAGVPMLDHVLRVLKPLSSISDIFIVSNERFAPHFASWIKARQENMNTRLHLINDHSKTEEDKLGAIGDLALTIREGKIADDMLVIAGDTLLSEDLAEFGAFAEKSRKPLIGVYEYPDLATVSRYSVVTLNATGIVTAFEEKPHNPQTRLVGIALYFYPKESLHFIEDYIAEGNNPDQPGRLVEWLYKRTPVGGFPLKGMWYDIGSRETLEAAHNVFSRLSSNHPK